MPLWLSEEDVSRLISVPECVDLMDRLFKEAAQGKTVNRIRSRLRMPGGFYHVMFGATEGWNAFGLKTYPSFRDPTCFIVLLYQMDTGQLLSIMEAQHLSLARTGAISGVAARYMAREDASTVGIIGTGGQASAQLEAVSGVRDIRSVKCFSRTGPRREEFAERMSRRLGIPVVAVESSEACVQDADIVITITTSRDPVFSGETLKEGATVIAAGSNHWMRREVDDATIRRSELVVVDDLEDAKVECGELTRAVERGFFNWEQCRELRDVAAGHISGRPRPESITLFESQGLAIEDVAAAMHVYQKAIAQGAGKQLPV